MRSARRHRGITGLDRRQAHIDWLKLIEVSGPFLSVPVLTAEWPDLEPLDNKARDRLRQEHRQWQENPAANRDGWIGYILDDLLGWQDAVQHEDLDRLSLAVPEHESVIRPSFSLIEPGTGQVRLLSLITEDSPVARVRGSDWPATPADRLALLCRHHGVELGLATDGRWWVLVWAPTGGVTTMAVFDAISWPDSSERGVVRAFLSLLERRRFFAVPPERQLPALLRESLNNQEEITDRLGVQVRQAVELLVAAFGRAGVGPEVTAHDVYRGAVAVMMRIVFLLFAEESGLLPADNEVYARAYSVGGLAAELEQRVADARGNEGELDHTYLAWHRLLALFTVVYQGVSHRDLELIAHDGSLFDPAGHAWMPLNVDDRTVLHMLRAVQTVLVSGELRTVSFRTLTVEQIGYVYEGLLSYEGFRAAEIVIGLTGKEGCEEEVPLRALESIAAAHVSVGTLAAKLAEEYKDSSIGSVRTLTLKLAPLTGDEKAQAVSRLYAVAKDDTLVQRLLPFYRIIRRDLRRDPVVILPGALYVTESVLRSSTGAHYTPRFLAEQVTEGALEPLVYAPGPLQTADRSQWKLREPEEILSLHVADIAMGSGAFLVAACRYLAGKLIEARSVKGNIDATALLARPPIESGLALDAAADRLVIEARREIIEHCLYGVDINPMAVEMAKLSLWLVSMDPHRPFTFLDDRLACGDSLLGVTSIEQLEWMHLDVAEGRKLHEGTVLEFMSGVRSLLSEVAEQRVTLSSLSGDTFDDVMKKRQLLADIQVKTKQLTRYANLIVGVPLAGSRTGGKWIIAAKLAHDAAIEGKVAAAEEQAEKWLATDQPDGSFARDPLHWPLAFPEIFGPTRSGFDAIIGNPPFMHGSTTRSTLGHSYREYLVENIADGFRKNADLVAFFTLRSHALVRKYETIGLIATSSLAQGDAREMSLDRLTEDSFEIYQAVANERWPTKSAEVRYCIIWTCRSNTISPDSLRLLDGRAAAGITSMLTPRLQQTGQPHRLAENLLQSFQGSKIEGPEFAISPETAISWIESDSSYSKVVFPYLDGRDLNNSPSCAPRRWVINFHNWPRDKACTYSTPYAHVLKYVKPERDQHKEKGCRENWWLYKRPTTELYSAISSFHKVVVMARVSSTLMPVLVPARQVFHEKVIVFTSSSPAFLAWLSSSFHYWWANEYKTTHGAAGDTQYSNGRCFETFPRPGRFDSVNSLGEKIDSLRRTITATRKIGLTQIYNLVNSPQCIDADIVDLRGVHRAIDETVGRAYGWQDLLADGLDHGFHETRQGVRYTIGPVVRQKILNQLLMLNHEKYAAEVKAGLHEKRGRKQAAQVGESTLF